MWGKLAQILATKSDDIWKAIRIARTKLPGLAAKGLSKTRVAAGRLMIAARSSLTWKKLGKAGLILTQEAAMWAIFSSIFNHDDAESTEIQDAQLLFLQELKKRGVDVEDYKSIEDMVAGVGLHEVLEALLDSGLYLGMRDFFRAAQFECDDEEAEIIESIRNLSDEAVEAATKEAQRGRIGTAPLSSALEGHRELKNKAAQIDELASLLRAGPRTRKETLRIVELIREDGGVDTELGMVPGLETL